VKNPGTARDCLQKALQYTLLYNNGTPIEFYYCANTLQVVLDQFVKKQPINNVYWSAFCIDRVKMLNINVKSEEPLKILKTISGSSPGVCHKITQNLCSDCPFKVSWFDN
jgi:hypothetical protein